MKDGGPARAANAAEVCAVVVTYHPDGEFPERLARILPQVGALIIVDNGSNEAELRMLREISADSTITLVPNPGNLGVARALNIGIQRAALKSSWALLLDQDSLVDDGMVRELLAVYASFPDKDHLAVIGSGFRDLNGGFHAPDIEITDQAAADNAAANTWIEVESVITSGSLVPLSAHAAVGPFRDEFFIDYVDTDYCFRARAQGMRVIKTRKPIMSHAIGAATQHGLLWMNKWTTNHSPDRRYYGARNDTVMLRDYGNYPFGSWALKSLARRWRTCKRIALYEEMKTAKIIAVMQGWWDGVRGRMGPRARTARPGA
ncbi:MAG: glycosyltransferase family 2 protein [Steroidobacteraceae bacterium]